MTVKTLFILLLSITLFSNCRKDVSVCREYQQAGQEAVIDTNMIDVPEFKVFLTQYPYLKPYEFNSDKYSSVMKCNVFWKGLHVLTDQYLVIKSKATGQMSVADTVRTYDLPVSVEPRVSYTDAIKEAKKIMDFDHTCIFYSLCIYDTGLHGAYNPNNYVLVWKIEGQKKYPLVILDANTKQIYRNTDGIVMD